MIGRKIVLIGTHGVGKTTLLNDFHAAHPEISVKNELIREIAKKDPTIKVNEDGDIRSQSIFFDAYMKEMMSEEEFIIDRGALDVVTYTGKVCERVGEFEEYQRQMKELVDLHEKYNDQITYVYIPPMIDLVGDEVRSDNAKYQKEIDDFLMTTIAMTNLELYSRCAKFTNTYVLPATDRKERVEQLYEVVTRHWINE